MSAFAAIYTHTMPVDAYRGAGRPEAAYVIERLVDQAARELGVARDALAGPQLRAAAEDAVYDRDGAHLRQRRVRRPYAPRHGSGGMGRLRAALQGGAQGRADPGHRDGDLCRGLRLRRGRARDVAPGRRRWRHDPHRHAIDRAGPHDGLCPDRGRAARPTDGAGARRAGRHRPRPLGRGHRRLALDPGRRRLGLERLAPARREPEGARGRRARGRRRRSRARGRSHPDLRHGPRHRLCRSREAARRPLPSA